MPDTAYVNAPTIEREYASKERSPRFSVIVPCFNEETQKVL